MIIVDNKVKFDLYILHKDRKASYVLLSSSHCFPLQNVVKMFKNSCVLGSEQYIHT